MQNARRMLELLCKHELGESLDAVQNIALDYFEVLECIWPLNDRFRPLMDELQHIAYQEEFEKAADDALEAFLLRNDDWSELPLVVWRVLLERHQQAILFCTTKSYGNEIMYIPDGLSEMARTKFAVGFFLYAMKLPF